MSGTIFESLEVVITLRCNVRCKNCIRFCNMRTTTGLDYDGLDMTIADVRAVCRDIEEVHRFTGRQVFDILCVTGGEPTLHPKLEEMWRTIRSLVPPYMVGKIVCNTNRTRPVPSEIEPHVVHWWDVRERIDRHQCALVSPTDPPPGFPVQGGQTWETCQCYRKTRMIVTAHGYQLCCAAEGYTRLLHHPELLVGKIPTSIDVMPKPDPVCDHCAFGAPVALSERHYGCPVSPVFDHAREENFKGRAMPKKLRKR